MNGRRSRLEIEAHNRANKELADENIGHWVPCVYAKNPHSLYELRVEGYDVMEKEGKMFIQRPSGQLFPTVAPVAPVKVAPVPVMAVAAELDTVDLSGCPYCKYAGQIIRIKDEMIAEQMARIIYLEARRDR
jgi:hypothetical protein